MLSPAIKDADFDASIRNLVNDIHGLRGSRCSERARQPQNCRRPDHLKVATASPGHGRALEESSVRRPAEVAEELSSIVGVSEADIEDALHGDQGYGHREPRSRPGQEQPILDLRQAFHAVPEEDALRVAAGLINDPSSSSDTVSIAESLGGIDAAWNAALSYLAGAQVIVDYQTLQESTIGCAFAW